MDDYLKMSFHNFGLCTSEKKKKSFHHGIQEQHAYNNPTAKVIIIINIVNFILVTTSKL